MPLRKSHTKRLSLGETQAEAPLVAQQGQVRRPHDTGLLALLRPSGPNARVCLVADAWAGARGGRGAE
eukprot:CAMPEP_0177235990 /NCGR_PEP_ID=MMETSP0367-20130122/45221_1 /TAXON_ID=447022 ORGANISM="Scrippsiella hangoei-like, Strain SHHI-4" /NCGR_SAMPLE_ID=MMETSP0367 /ASSEMBLY_ACC=CAM_ASM_000362 /LENGTH=67 /DNA_ID=CAMNT_0018686881 /DNA_START=164 /DNA_END=367 /DNA_ORIENTATION=-